MNKLENFQHSIMRIYQMGKLAISIYLRLISKKEKIKKKLNRRRKLFKRFYWRHSAYVVSLTY